MYIAVVLLLMLVFPVASVLIERYFLNSNAGILPLVGKWFVFWGVGIRLAVLLHNVVDSGETIENGACDRRSREPAMGVNAAKAYRPDNDVRKAEFAHDDPRLRALETQYRFSGEPWIYRLVGAS